MENMYCKIIAFALFHLYFAILYFCLQSFFSSCNTSFSFAIHLQCFSSFANICGIKLTPYTNAWSKKMVWFQSCVHLSDNDFQSWTVHRSSWKNSFRFWITVCVYDIYPKILILWQRCFPNVCFWDVFVIFWMQCFILQEFCVCNSWTCLYSFAKKRQECV